MRVLQDLSYPNLGPPTAFLNAFTGCVARAREERGRRHRSGRNRWTSNSEAMSTRNTRSAPDQGSSVCRRLGLALASVLVVLLASPALRYAAIGRADGTLAGYSDAVPDAPHVMWSTIADKSLQRWVERFADAQVGFRAALVRTFNEVAFALFGEIPRVLIYSTPEHGLYSSLALDGLRDRDEASRDAESIALRAEASRLRQVQDLLARNGTEFVVVLAASKPSVYDDDLEPRLLRRGRSPWIETVQFDDVLRASGVNVIDGVGLLRDFVSKHALETHAAPGVHWNYYAGCIVASALVEFVRARRPDDVERLDCGAPVMESPHMVDVDGWSLLNIWTHGNLFRETPYPSIPPPAASKGKAPSYLFVSDSFVDQILYAMRAAHSSSRLVTSGYFAVRAIDQDDTAIPAHAPSISPDVVRADVLRDVHDVDVVVLEMVDYNIPRLGYGFSQYVLSHAETVATLRHGPAVGAYAEESDGVHTWNWVKDVVRFDFDLPKSTLERQKTRIRFEYGTRTPQKLTLRLELANGDAREFTFISEPGPRRPFDETIDVAPRDVRRVTIASDGEATVLSANDPRVAAWIVQDMRLEPVAP
jgi:hypothetical protein